MASGSGDSGIAAQPNDPGTWSSGELQPGLKATFEMPQYPGWQFECDGGHDVERDGTQLPQHACRTRGRQCGRQALRGRLLPGALPDPERPQHAARAGDALIPAKQGAQVAALSNDNNVVFEIFQARPLLRRQRLGAAGSHALLAA